VTGHETPSQTNFCSIYGDCGDPGEVGDGGEGSRAAGDAAENLATLRRLALNLLKGEKTRKRGICGKQLNASWDHAYLLHLLGVPV
jgi:hypothetical protein